LALFKKPFNDLGHTHTDSTQTKGLDWWGESGWKWVGSGRYACSGVRPTLGAT